jgi:(p)ppGpp synthase/HD superfamily hydrolase
LDLLEQAIGIAVEAHRGQRDRCGAPYILHPLRVMFRVATTRERIVAILHDVVEDTAWTFQDLTARGFPAAIVEALDCVTKRDGEDYDHFVQRSGSNSLARQVKIADLEDNMDLRRAQELNDKERERLQKYVRAWRALVSENSLCP